ncbi:hypothetical protein GCM10010172_48100 [Paractinoplanes ferrugineus]|uniref:Ricin B lectin domain-containing protein n=1 Tax=Paractinoplanes ferrugineus TaxID=113564 RepID=A0A919M924_9ACTN|nr:ricin-type beta-trefoil lectin domain protein [Actinoplanes ferrugineus]GIE11071.1 hypothetical protein Afe05nite_29110 [Actinoplanes ferrugineus]
MMRIKPVDDRGSLPMALLLTLVGMTLSATMATMVISAVRASSYGIRRGLDLHAAQAGLEVARAQVRGAVKPGTVMDDDGDYAGFNGMLPCGPLTGFVDAAQTMRYAVTIAYYQTDPQDMSDADLTAKKVTCTGLQAPAKVPAFALFTSTGNIVGQTQSRTLTGTYIVHTSNANISGGLIHIYRAANSSVTDLCVDAGSGNPPAGYKVTMQPCSAGKVSQSWAYTSLLQIQLVSSQNPDHVDGLCLDSAIPHAANGYVYMALCKTPAGANSFSQAWSFNDSANLMGSKPDGSDIDSFCFNVTAAATPGAQIYLQSNCNKSYDNVQTFSADANVGAGAASSDTNRALGQLINYAQFGRCLDDTGKNINATNMIAWPCKQNPNPNKVSWNQRYMPEKSLPAGKGGQPDNKIKTVIKTSTTLAAPWYCLQSPLATSVGSYVTTKLCVDGQANQQWTIYGRTDQYATSYIYVDSAGYCLQPRAPNASPPDLYQTVNSISKIYVAKCDGNTLQKWNANKNVIDALALKDLSEK